MKQLFTTLFLSILFFSSQAQVLFQHDFSNGMAPMTTVNADGRTPAPNVSGFAEAWSVVVPGRFGNEGHAAVSTSWFSPPGVADRWMMTPAIELPEEGDNLLLTWIAKAQDAQFPDGYEVRVSRTGTEIADFEDVIFSINAENPEFTNRAVSLGDYLGDTIHIAFRNNSNDMFLLVVGDIVVQSLKANDVILTDILTPRYHLIDEPVTVVGTVENTGANPITSLDITWTFNGETQTDNIEGLNIETFESYTFEHAIPVVVPASTSYDLTVEVSNPNGDSEVELNNVSTSSVFTGVSQVPLKRVVVEEGTGTWCGWCPRGFVAMEHMIENYPETFIGIGVHNQDPMALAEHDSNVGLSGYPGSNVDRLLLDIGVSTNVFETAHDFVSRSVVPVGVEAEAMYDAESRTVDINATASFYSELNDVDFRFSVIMVEDSVVGTTSGYAQVNFYSFQTANLPLVGYGFNWQEEPDPVPASKMFYNDVSRAILGGFNGVSGSIPENITDGLEVTYSTEYTVPDNFDADNMRAVVLVLDAETGQILNAVQTELEVTTSVSQEDIAIGYSVYPNPASDEVTIDIELEQTSPVTLRVVNMLGQQIDMQQLGTFEGRTTFNYNVSQLPSGVYSFVIQVNESISTRQLTVK